MKEQIKVGKKMSEEGKKKEKEVIEIEPEDLDFWADEDLEEWEEEMIEEEE